jgi:hypothetical protein
MLRYPGTEGQQPMWHGFDPNLKRELENIRKMVGLRHQTPTREWPLVFVEEHDVLLVVREWPDGTITAYATNEFSDEIRGDDPPKR